MAFTESTRRNSISMANLSKAVNQLRIERGRVARELERLDEAIALLGKLDLRGGRGGARGLGMKRRLSPAARRRIAQAQRERWARWKQQQKRGNKAA
jgi:hypothetical protein